MMLEALLEYAEREHLGDPYTEQVQVRWLIPVTSPGKLAGPPIPLVEDPSAKNPKPKTMRRPFTSANEMNQGDKSHFLCDNLARSGLLRDPKDPKDHSNQHAYFRSLIATAAEGCPDESSRLLSLLAMLNDHSQLAKLEARLREAGAKPTDNATFRSDGATLIDSRQINQYWRKLRDVEARRRTGTIGTCLATGKRGEILDTHEKIKGLPATTMGANLISLDKESFRSYGLEQARNAPLSPHAELCIRAALESLIAKSKSQRLVFGNAVTVHWTRRPAEFDPTELISSADPEAVAALLSAPGSGKRPAIQANDYYASTLSANGARIVVRDWLESTVSEVENRVAQWFADLRIVEPDAITSRAAHKLYALIASALPNKGAAPDFDRMPPQWPATLMRCALTGARLPDSILAAALRRQQLEAKIANPTRAALIKLALIRRAAPNHKEPAVPQELDPETKNPAYLCGRLFATLERAQFLALGKINANITDRFYASASVTPSLVMGRLLRNAQFHLAKASGGAAENIRKEIESIATSLGPTFPPILDLDAQGRFALGYYQQRAENRRRAAERPDDSKSTNATA